jgi:hypothetical protein
VFITFFPGGGGGGGGAAASGQYTPSLEFLGAWEAGVITADSWLYTVATTGGLSVVTVFGTLSLTPGGAASSDQMFISLPVAPSGNFTYPAQISGVGVPSSAARVDAAGANEPVTVVAAEVGGLRASVFLYAIDAAARDMAFSFSYPVA